MIKFCLKLTSNIFSRHIIILVISFQLIWQYFIIDNVYKIQRSLISFNKNHGMWHSIKGLVRTWSQHILDLLINLIYFILGSRQVDKVFTSWSEGLGLNSSVEILFVLNGDVTDMFCTWKFCVEICLLLTGKVNILLQLLRGITVYSYTWVSLCVFNGHQLYKIQCIISSFYCDVYIGFICNYSFV